MTQRFYSMFDLQDPTNRDRVAMLREGVRMIEADPLTGMGPNMVERLYIRFRDTEAVERVNPHLHNVPMQIAAERGLPALGVWVWFVGAPRSGPWPLLRRGRAGFWPPPGSAPLPPCSAPGMFEHNFGDSEFLMLFLVLITLPFAAERDDPAEGPASRGDTLSGDSVPSHPSVLAASRARELVARFPASSVLIVGDVMLDQFVVGRVSRISPEAPVPVVEHDHDEYRIGGAGNVAANVRALGVGRRTGGAGRAGPQRGTPAPRTDAAPDRLRRPGGGSGRPTTTKQRIVTTRNQQVARVDYEADTEAAGAVEAQIVAQALGAARPGRRRHRLRLPQGRRHARPGGGARGAGAGPGACRCWSIRRSRTSTYYAGTTLVTPNHHEAEMATHLRIRTDEDARRAGHVFVGTGALQQRAHHAWRARHVAGGPVGRGPLPGGGARGRGRHRRGRHRHRNAGSGLAAGASLAEAAQLANQAAGIVVRRFGPATVTPDELLAEFA